MVWILSGIESLIQYKNDIESRLEKALRPDRCEHCGRLKPWCHGNYLRKSGRTDEDRLFNPVPIQRFYCPDCGKTMSVLPECIPPQRWYLWETQQATIVLFLLGKSARAIEKQLKPSRHTIKRWVAWLMVQFKQHKDTLCTHLPWLGFYVEPVRFWKHAFDKLSLSTAMYLCHVSGVSIP